MKERWEAITSITGNILCFALILSVTPKNKRYYFVNFGATFGRRKNQKKSPRTSKSSFLSRVRDAILVHEKRMPFANILPELHTEVFLHRGKISFRNKRC